MRHLAIDYGTKRIGLALSDEGGRFATPLDVIEVTTIDVLIDDISKLIQRESIQQIVVGLPLNMDGTHSSMTRQVIQFARTLRDSSGLSTLFVDERLSSFDAEQQLIEMKRKGAKLTRQMKKDRLDALSAASFLQAYLDGKIHPINVTDP